MKTTCLLTIGLVLFIKLGAVADDVPLPEHPRPDFQRAAWVNLNGQWQFQFDAKSAGEAEGWFEPGKHRFARQIAVPFPWESKLSGIAVGSAARVKVDAERDALPGKVEHVAQKTEFTPRFLFSERERPNLVVRVRVRIDDPGRRLHAGIPAFVSITPRKP